MTEPSPPGAAPQALAVLEHLTGPARGRAAWLGDAVVEATIGPDRVLRLTPAGLVTHDHDGPPPCARLLRDGDRWRVEAAGDSPLWVNRVRVTEAPLRDGDVIEFGDAGPISRFHGLRNGALARRAAADVAADAVTYLRASRQPLPRRLARAAGSVAHRLAFESTIVFRAGVLAALLLAAIFVWRQQTRLEELERSVAADVSRLEAASAAIARSAPPSSGTTRARRRSATRSAPRSGLRGSFASRETMR